MALVTATDSSGSRNSSIFARRLGRRQLIFSFLAIVLIVTVQIKQQERYITPVLYIYSSHSNGEHSPSVQVSDEGNAKSSARPVELDSRPTAAICCIVIHEGAYLREWVDYHLAIGFSHLYIYDNSEDFEMQNWSVEKTTVTHFPGRLMQAKAYLDCVLRFGIPKNHTWMAFYDVDEYLALFQHSNVVDFLMEYNLQGDLSIRWHHMTWSNHSQYSPLPVTKRFQYMAPERDPENDYVKSIAVVADIDTSQEGIEPHSTHLKPNRTQKDTLGNVLSLPMKNNGGPTDVALIYHYKTKSWKEYIAKRMRGTAAWQLSNDVSWMIAQAKSGHALQASKAFDDTIWQRMTQMCPQYKMFDQDLGAGNSPMLTNTPIIICTHLQSNDEFYVDEWVDYHLALGVTHVYLYDFSDEAWMKQWGDLKQTQTGGRVLVVPFGKPTATTIYQDCSQRIQKHVRGPTQVSLTPLNVDEFIMLHTKGSLADLLKPLRKWPNLFKRQAPSPPCAALVPVLPFGTSGQIVYEPLPVTKRFTHRIITEELYFKPIVSNTAAKLAYLISHPSLNSSTWKWNSSASLPECSSTRMPSEGAYIYQYRRSMQECRTLASEVTGSINCSATGTLFHDFAWTQMKRYLPKYSDYDSLYI
jgi:hypothetical protein